LPQTKVLFKEMALEKKAPAFFASEIRQITEWKWGKNELITEVATTHKTDRQLYHLDLTALYQTKNLLTVLETISQLQRKGWTIEDSVLKKSLQQVKKLTGLHGRWEIIHNHPLIVMDVAHNEDGVKELVKQIEITDHTNLHIVLGIVKDKEVDSILKLFPDRAEYYFTHAHIPRALDAEILKQKAFRFGLKGRSYDDVNTALHDAFHKAGKDDMILICGSVFLIGEVNDDLPVHQ